MRITFADFDPHQHLAAASVLLAQRHRRDRERDSRLIQTFETAAECRRLIAETCEVPLGFRGVMAYVADVPVGYMLMAPLLVAPTDFSAGYFPLRAAFVGYTDYAAVADLPSEIYSDMYAVLAAHFVHRGYFEHLIAINPSDAELNEACAALGFARHNIAVLRDTAPPKRPSADIHIRRALTADAHAIWALSEELRLHHTKSPTFWPYDRAAEPAFQKLQHELLAAAQSSPHWLACENGKPIGFIAVQTGSFLSPTQQPACAVYIFQSIVSATARATGVGTALLAECAKWATAQGFAHLVTHFSASNFKGARFWLSSDFKPVEYLMRRSIDERIAWANQ